MVAIISSEQLGLTGSQTQHQYGTSSMGQAGESVTINIANGNLVIHRNDEILLGLGGATDILRVYNSQGELNYDSIQGEQAWWFNTFQRLIVAEDFLMGDRLEWISADGATILFTFNAETLTYTTTDGQGAHDVMRFNESEQRWELTFGESQHQAWFNQAGLLIAELDADGNTTEYFYNDSQELVKILDASGQIIEFLYEQNRIAGIKSFQTQADGQVIASQVVQYFYDELGRLNEVVIDLSPEDNAMDDGDVYRILYGYEENSHRLSWVEQTDQSRLDFTYTFIDNEYRIHTITDGEGQITTFQYFDTNDTTNSEGFVSESRTDVINHLGAVTSYYYDEFKRITQIVTPAVSGQRDAINYEYDTDDNVVQITQANGNAIYFSYDSQGNLVREADSDGKVILREYDELNQLVAEIRFLESDPDGLGVLLPETEVIKQFIYDGTQLKYTVSETGEVTEFIYNHLGQLERQTSFANLSIDITATQLNNEAQLVNTLSLDDLTSWTASYLENLEVRSVFYHYDFRGQIAKIAYINEPSYKNITEINVAAFFISPTADASIIDYIYDENGRLLQKQGGSEGVTTYLYDGLGRVLQTSNANNEVVITEYLDSLQKVATTAANGLTTTSHFDKSGRITSVIKTDSLAQREFVTQYFYDVLGRKTAVQDSTGAMQYWIYDEKNRLVALVDDIGVVTTFEYDEADQITKEILHSGVVNTQDWLVGSDVFEPLNIEFILPHTQTSEKRIRQKFYDQNGELQFQISENGLAVEYVYDERGQLLQALAYDQPVILSFDRDYTTFDIAEILRPNAYSVINENTLNTTYDVPDQPYAMQLGSLLQQDTITQFQEMAEMLGVSVVNESNIPANTNLYGWQHQLKATTTLAPIYIWGNPEYIFKAEESQLQYNHVLDEQNVELTSQLTTAGQEITWESGYWHQDFSEDTDGLAGALEVTSLEDGVLRINSIYNNEVTLNANIIASNLVYDTTEPVVFNATITTSDSMENRNFKIGVSNGESGDESLVHQIAFLDRVILSESWGQQYNPPGFMGFNTNETTYHIEIRIVDGISQISIYPDGTDPNQAMVHTLDSNLFEQAQFFIEAVESIDFKEPSYFDLHEITTQGKLVDTHAEVLYRPVGTTEYQTATAEWLEGRYHVNITGAPGFYDVILVERDSQGNVISQIEQTIEYGVAVTQEVQQTLDISYVEAAEGVKITNFFETEAERANVSRVVAKVYDINTGALVSEAVTIPRFDDGYYGHVNLANHGLAHGEYSVVIELYQIDGTQKTYPPFIYDYGDTQSIVRQTLQWEPEVVSAETVVLRYRTYNSNEAYQEVEAQRLGDFYQVAFDDLENKVYEYEIYYLDVDGNVLMRTAEKEFAVRSDIRESENGFFDTDYFDTVQVEGASFENFDFAAYFSGITNSDDYQNIAKITTTLTNTKTNYTYDEEIILPSEFAVYEGQLLLSSSPLSAGYYHITVHIEYLDGSEESVSEIPLEWGHVNTQFIWPAGEDVELADVTFRYRLFESDEEWQSAVVTRDEHGNFVANVTELEPFSTYEYSILQGIGPTSSQGYDHTIHTGGTFQSRAADETFTLHQTRTVIVGEERDGWRLEEVFTAEEAENIHYINAYVTDLASGAYLSQMETYPAFYDDYQGEVNLSRLAETLTSGQFKVELTIHYRDGSTETREIVIENGVQKILERTTVFKISASQVPNGQSLVVKSSELGLDDWQTLERQGDYYILQVEDKSPGRYLINLGLQSGEQVETFGATYVYVDNQDRQGFVSPQEEIIPSHRLSQYLYDDMGRLVATIDPEGYVKENVYNFAGELVKTIAYANPSQLYAIASNTRIENIRPISDSRDQVKYSIYNGKGQQIATLDEQGYLSETHYDVQGRVDEIIRYGASLLKDLTDQQILDRSKNILTYYDIDDLRRQAQSNDAGSQTTKMQYDALGRVTQEISTFNVATTYEYDAAGNIIRRQIGSGETARVILSRYDQEGRLISELSGEAAQWYEDADGDLKPTLWATLATTYHYDSAGRRVATEKVVAGSFTDLSTIKRATEYYIYDQNNRIIATINATGEVQTTEYNEHGQVTVTRYYVDRINLAEGIDDLHGGTESIVGGVASEAILATLVNLKSDKDFVLTNHYDAVGQLETLSDNAERYTDYVYNTHGEVIETTQLLDKVTNDELVTQYTYDARGLKTAEKHIGSDALTRTSTTIYDAFGRVIQESDFKHNWTHYDYDRLGRVISITDRLENTSFTEYDAFNRVVSQTDALGATTYYQFDDQSHTLTITSAAGNVIKHIMNDFDEVIEIIDAEKNREIFVYNEDGQQISREVFDKNGVSLGVQMTHTYDVANNLKSMTALNGVTIEYVYDSVARRVQEITQAEGKTLTKTYAFDGKGNQVLETNDTDGIQKRTRYDAANRVIAIETLSADGLLNQVSTIEYNENNQEILVSVGTLNNPYQRQTRYEYDELGRRVKEIIDPDGFAITTSFTYDLNNNVQRKIDANGLITDYVYDAEDQKWQDVVDGRETQRTFYDANGQIERIDDEVTGATYFIYDADGRQRFVINALGEYTELRYDANGRVIESLRYFDQLPSHLFPNDSFTPTLEQLETHSKTVNNERVYSAYTQYDALSRITGQLDSEGYAVTMTYNSKGQLSTTHYWVNKAVVNSTSDWTLTPSNEDRLSYHFYDELGREVFTLSATGQIQQRVYLDNGLLAKEVSYLEHYTGNIKSANTQTLSNYVAALGQEVQAQKAYFYDGLNRVELTVNANGAATKVTYDELGNILSSTAYASPIVHNDQVPSATINDRHTYFVYNHLGQKIYEIDANGYVKHAIYDQATGLVISTRYYENAITPANYPLESLTALLAENPYTQQDTIYDSKSRVRFTIDAMGYVTENIYTLSGLVHEVRHYQETIHQQTYNEQSIQTALSDLTFYYDVYEYDALGRAILHIDAENYLTSWTYDAFGNLLTETRDNSITLTYTYNGNNQQTSVINPSALFSSESTGLTQTTETLTTHSEYNHLGQLTYSYDNLGYRHTQYIYDNEGQLRFEINAERQIIEYRYDALGRKVTTFHYEKPLDTNISDFSASYLAQVDLGPNRTTHTLYNASGQLIYTINALGQTTQNIYNTFGDLTFHHQYLEAIEISTLEDVLKLDTIAALLTGQESLRTEYQYNHRGEQETLIDAKGYVENYEYDARGNRISFTNKNGDTWTYIYNANDQLVSQFSPEVSVQLSNETAPVLRSLETYYTYDAQGNILTSTEAYGTLDAITITYEYDNLGRQVKVIYQDPGIYNESTGRIELTNDNIVIETYYDAFGNAIANKNAMGYSAFKSYDAMGRVIYALDEAGYITEYQYNAYGEQVKMIRYSANAFVPSDEKPSFDQSVELKMLTASWFQQFTEKDDNYRVVITEYDNAGRKIAVEQSAVNNAYNALYSGNPRTEYVYDGYDQVIQESIKVSSTEYWHDYNFYNALGQLVGRINAEGYVTYHAYNDLGQQVTTIEYAMAYQGEIPATIEEVIAAIAGGDREKYGNDRISVFEYDELGRQTKIHQLGITYDAINYQGTDEYADVVDESQQASDFVSVVTYNDQTLTQILDYDKVGNNTAITYASGLKNITHYDALGKVTSQEERDNLTLLKTTEMTLNAHGQVVYSQIKAGDEQRTASYLYDYQGRAVRVTDTTGHQQYIVYNKNGDVTLEWQIISQQYGDWSEENYQHRMESHYDYDLLGRRIGQRELAGYNAFGEPQYNDYDAVEYNAFGEIKTRWEAGDSVIDYIYDNAGRLIQTSGINANIDYYYNLAGYLVTEANVGLRDQASDGNPILTDESLHRITHYEVDGLGRTLIQKLPGQISGIYYENRQYYDRWGNVIESIDAQGNATYYQFNHNNQVTKIIHPTVLMGAEQTAFTPIETFSYDMNGARVIHTDMAGEARFSYVNNLGQLMWETDAYGYRTRYDYDDWGNQVLKINNRGDRHIQKYDINGRVIEIGIEVGGYYQRIESYSYDEVGNRTHKFLRGDDGAVEYTVFDIRGNVVATRTAEGVIKRYEYDEQNRKIKEIWGDGAASLIWNYNGDRLWSSYDLSGNYTRYYYNDFGDLARETVVRDAAISDEDINNLVTSRDYTHYHNGWVQSITDYNNQYSDKRISQSEYVYDKMGRRVTETNSARDSLTNQTLYYRALNTTYDALGRLSSISSPNSYMNAFDQYHTTTGIDALNYYYDKNGNREQITVKAIASNGVVSTKEYWYTYDKENRLVISQGRLNENGDIVLSSDQGGRFVYNSLGQRAYADTLEIREGRRVVRHEAYIYNFAGELLKINAYEDEEWEREEIEWEEYREDWVSEYAILNPDLADEFEFNENATADPDSSRYKLVDERHYNAAGYVTSHEEYFISGQIKSFTQNTYNKDGQVTSQRTSVAEEPGDALKLNSVVTYGSNAYDDFGNLVAYTVYAYDEEGKLAHRDVYTQNYQGFDSYKLQFISVYRYDEEGKQVGDQGRTVYYFDARGDLMSVSSNEGVEREGAVSWERIFYNNRDGQLVARIDERDDGEDYKIQDYFFTNGQWVGSNGSLDGINFDLNYQPINESVGNATTSYIVNGGDTLESIAQSLWGDRSLWYLIADANAIYSNDELQAGERLTIPNVNSNFNNNSDVFKPYNPGEIIGNTTPTPVPPPPPKNGCNPIVTIVMVAVAVIATIYTAGAAAGLFTAGAVTSGSAVVTGAAFVGASLGTAAGVAAGAFVGGVVGSVASQLVGKALGAVESFSLRQAVSSGLTTAATAGIGNVVGQVADKFSYLQGADWAQAAIQGAAGSVTSYAANKIAGIDTSFKWKNVIASAASSSISSSISGELGLNATNIGNDFVGGFIGGAVSSTVSRVMGIGGKQDWAGIAADAFGNAIGNSLGGKHQYNLDNVILQKARQQQGQLSQEDYAKLSLESRSKYRDLANQLGGSTVQNEQRPTYTKEQAQAIADSFILNDETLAQKYDPNYIPRSVDPGLLASIDATHGGVLDTTGLSLEESRLLQRRAQAVQAYRTNATAADQVFADINAEYAKLGQTGSIDHQLAINSRIVSDYAQFGLDNPEFVWAQLAASVAYDVRLGVLASEHFEAGFSNELPALFTDSASNASLQSIQEEIIQAQINVYKDVLPLAQVYAEFGGEAAAFVTENEIFLGPQLAEARTDVAASYRALDRAVSLQARGDITGARKAQLEAATLLLQHEQRDVLQDLYNRPIVNAAFKQNSFALQVPGHELLPFVRPYNINVGLGLTIRAPHAYRTADITQFDQRWEIARNAVETFAGYRYNTNAHELRPAPRVYVPTGLTVQETVLERLHFLTQSRNH
ncbi:MAG: LysM peptidoglycan-binding domain-containing protein [Pseudomonadota bacterium]